MCIDSDSCSSHGWIFFYSVLFGCDLSDRFSLIYMEPTYFRTPPVDPVAKCREGRWTTRLYTVEVGVRGIVVVPWAPAEGPRATESRTARGNQRDIWGGREGRLWLWLRRNKKGMGSGNEWRLAAGGIRETSLFTSPPPGRYGIRGEISPG